MAPEVHSERETAEPANSVEVPVEHVATSELGGDGSGSGDSTDDIDTDTDDIDDTGEDADSAAAGSLDSADDSPDPVEEAQPPGRRRVVVLLSVAATALAVDIVSKLLVVAKLSGHDPVRLPGGFLWLNLIRNSGAAFSIGEGQTWVFTIIAVAVAVVILRISRNLRSVPWACALGLLLGGALGNLGDRIFRSPGFFRGHVVDFLQFPRFPVVEWDFPVFNLADSAIVVGGCLMVLLSFRGIQPDGTRHTHDRTRD